MKNLHKDSSFEARAQVEKVQYHSV